MFSASLLAEMLLRTQPDFFAVERVFFVFPPKPFICRVGALI